jgi:quinol monooxygenase YgiN
MSRVLFHAVHYPHPQHLDDLLGSMSRIMAAAPAIEGLESIGAYADEAGGRIFAISVWASPEALQAATATFFASIADLPFDVWERKPRELLMLPEVELPAPAPGGRTTIVQ